MASKRSLHWIKLLMSIGVSIQQRLSLQRCHRLTMLLIVWFDYNLKLLENGVTHLRDKVTSESIFRLMLYSHEDVSFNTIFLNVFKGIKQFHLSMWFMKNQLETQFKGDNVKALIKRQIVKTAPLFL